MGRTTCNRSRRSYYNPSENPRPVNHERVSAPSVPRTPQNQAEHNRLHSAAEKQRRKAARRIVNTKDSDNE